jgi:glycosyltransferase involved in cell wall biosynthesis
MKVAAFIDKTSACDYYRVDLPLNTLKKTAETLISTIEKGDPPDVIAKALEADIIVARGVADQGLVDAFKGLQKGGKKIVLDYDDNLFDVSPTSPHYQYHGLKEVMWEFPDGKKKKVWEDGKTINIKENKKNMESFKEALFIADAVSVTTDLLAEKYKPYNSNTIVLPNCIDTKLWTPLDFKEKDEVRLTWFGGASHYDDWCILKDVLPDIMRDYLQVKLVIMGVKFDNTLKGIPEDRIEFHPWVSMQAYPYKAAILNPTIAIIPLIDNRFNKCKSALKWVEMASLGVPAVTSYVSPYKEIATEENGVFVENSYGAWDKGIRMLLDDKILRAKIGGEAQRTVYDKFDINNEYKQWKQTYERLVA